MLFIFDLDGTLTPQRPASNAPFERMLLAGVKEKCAALRQAGARLAIASNQGGAKLSKADRLTIGQIQAQVVWIRSELQVDVVRFAIGDKRKKPSPAMLLEICHEWQVPPEDVVFVGDATTDKEAAMAAGVKFCFAEDFFND